MGIEMQSISGCGATRVSKDSIMRSSESFFGSFSNRLIPFVEAEFWRAIPCEYLLTVKCQRHALKFKKTSFKFVQSVWDLKLNVVRTFCILCLLCWPSFVIFFCKEQLWIAYVKLIRPSLPTLYVKPSLFIIYPEHYSNKPFYSNLDVCRFNFCRNCHLCGNSSLTAL